MNLSASSRSESPFTTIQHFSELCPEFTVGALRWLIFNRREELLDRGVIRYWGKKVLIHKVNFLTSSWRKTQHRSHTRFN